MENGFPVYFRWLTAEASLCLTFPPGSPSPGIPAFPSPAYRWTPRPHSPLSPPGLLPEPPKQNTSGPPPSCPYPKLRNREVSFCHTTKTTFFQPLAPPAICLLLSFGARRAAVMGRRGRLLVIFLHVVVSRVSHLSLGRHKQAENSQQLQPSPACVLQYPCRERGGCLSSPFNLLENEKQTEILKGGSQGGQKEKPAIAHWYERFPYEPVSCRQARGASSRAQLSLSADTRMQQGCRALG